jgi:hypothetical protein
LLGNIARYRGKHEEAAARGEDRRALHLAVVAATLRVQTNLLLAPVDQVALARRLAPAREALGAEEQAEAWGAGQAMT